jgi:NAD(P)-dependent dehydrogenase (short-subunit alcohol dehydrogenase family)
VTGERLAGRAAVVTGGAGGAGRASCLAFARAGARVAIVDVRADAAEALAGEIRQAGGDAHAFAADVSEEGDVRRAFAGAEAALGPPDILFNHAGTVIVKRLVDMSVGEWDRLMAINVRSMFLACREALPRMEQNGGGVILNTSSISGVTASPFESAYCATKGAVLQLTRAVAVEYRHAGIRCNAICPGFIRTDHGMRELEELAAQGVPVSEEAIAESQGRLCEPEEVASVALALVSDDCVFVNGAALYVDNGWMALT